MKKQKKELNEQLQLIDEIVEKYKKEFEGLNEKQKTLLAYRKIIELRKDGNSISNILNDVKNDKNEKTLDNVLTETDELLAIIKATDFECGLIKPLVLYVMCNSDNEYKKLYKNSLISYNKVLENYKLLSKELNIDNSLDLSHLFTYMLWNGYYSVNKKHSYKLQERLLLPGMYSFDVIKGKGVCLAYAELLHNYLTTCDKKSSILSCKVPTGKKSVSPSYRPDIKRNVENSISSQILNKLSSPFLKGLTNKFGNHAVTLIEENDKLFVYDPTNLYVLNIVDENTASIINGNGEFQIKPLQTLLLQPDTDPNQLFEKLLKDNIEQAFNRKKIIFSFENMMETIQNNVNLLDDAYDNIHSELEIINNQTNEIGGHFKALRKIRKMEKQENKLES